MKRRENNKFQLLPLQKNLKFMLKSHKKNKKTEILCKMACFKSCIISNQQCVSISIRKKSGGLHVEEMRRREIAFRRTNAGMSRCD